MLQDPYYRTNDTSELHRAEAMCRARGLDSAVIPLYSAACVIDNRHNPHSFSPSSRKCLLRANKNVLTSSPKPTFLRSKTRSLHALKLLAVQGNVSAPQRSRFPSQSPRFPPSNVYHRQLQSWSHLPSMSLPSLPKRRQGKVPVIPLR